MTLGMTFPIKDPKEGEPASVPWSLLEPHRSRAMQNHHQPLERLYATGGLNLVELARVITDKAADATMSDTDARKILGIKEPSDAKTD